MPAPADLVYQQSTTSGTGNLALSAVTGRRTFASTSGTGPTTNVFDYFIFGDTFDEWEQGTGHMSNSTTLVRDTVVESSNGNALVNFSGGILNVTNAVPARNIVRNESSTNSDGDVAVMDGTSGRKIKSGGGRGRNRIVNPLLSFAQAGVGSTSDGSYSGIDQWYVLTQTAAVTSSQLTAVADGVPSMGRLNQDQATAQRFGWAQVFEKSFVDDLRSKTVSLAAKVRLSAATTLRYAIIEWTGTADTVTKDVVNSWTNTTFTAGQFFSATSLTIAATGSLALAANTVTDISLSAAISSSMNNLIVFFWTDSAQAQNVTLDIGNVFFGQGASAPAVFDKPDPAADFQLCQRYLQVYSGYAASGRPFTGINSNTTNSDFPILLPVSMRVGPSLTYSALADWSIVTAGTVFTLSALVLNSSAPALVVIRGTSGSSFTSGNVSALRVVTGPASSLTLDARL